MHGVGRAAKVFSKFSPRQGRTTFQIVHPPHFYWSRSTLEGTSIPGLALVRDNGVVNGAFNRVILRSIVTATRDK